MRKIIENARGIVCFRLKGLGASLKLGVVISVNFKGGIVGFFCGEKIREFLEHKRKIVASASALLVRRERKRLRDRFVIFFG